MLNHYMESTMGIMSEVKHSSYELLVRFLNSDASEEAKAEARRLFEEFKVEVSRDGADPLDEASTFAALILDLDENFLSP